MGINETLSHLLEVVDGTQVVTDVTIGQAELVESLGQSRLVPARGFTCEICKVDSIRAVKF